MSSSVVLLPENVQFDPRISKDAALMSSLVTASGVIPDVFGNAWSEFQFFWQPKDLGSRTDRLELKAVGPDASAVTRLRYEDVQDSTQVRRKLYELLGELLSQQTRKSIDELRDMISQSDAE